MSQYVCVCNSKMEINPLHRTLQSKSYINRLIMPVETVNCGTGKN